MVSRLSYFTAEGAKGLLKQWYAENNPYEIAKSGKLVHVEVKGLPLPVSDSSYRIEWVETIRSHTGVMLDQQTYEATAAVQIVPPTSDAVLLHNPGGGIHHGPFGLQGHWRDHNQVARGNHEEMSAPVRPDRLDRNFRSGHEASPAVSPSATDILHPKPVPLNDKEHKALQLSGQWLRSNPKPYMAGGGKLVYVHGASRPTIIAAPMQVCDVELESGEKINEIVVGDSARWLVESGTAGNTTHLFIKPVDTGLTSSAVVTTDRRVYHLRLVSQHGNHTPYVGFSYSDTMQKAASRKRAQEDNDRQWQSTADANGKTVDLSKLNFNYKVEGSAAWKPERVYDDGLKTYIKLPRTTNSGEIPVLLVRKGGKDVLVNYRVQDSTMMVDGLFDTLALIVGVGSDQENEIRRMR